MEAPPIINNTALWKKEDDYIGATVFKPRISLITGGSLPFDLTNDVKLSIISTRFAYNPTTKTFYWDPMIEKPNNDDWDTTDAKLP